MKLSVSKDADPNYLAVVVTIPEIKPHPNADKLSCVEIFGNIIIIAKDMYAVGDKVVYFPVESCLKPEFLSWANLFDKPELNADEKTKGFFQKHNRVKAINLRSIPSQGFLYKTEQLAKYYKISDSEFKVGESFDTVGDHQLVTKYVRPESNSGQQNFKKSKIPAWVNNTLGYLPKPVRRMVYPPIKWYYKVDSQEGFKSRIVEGQFHYHYKTEHLGKNIFALNPDDNITITHKCHGTSAIYGNLLCKRNLSLLDRLYKACGKAVKETEYKLVYSSRSVVKNRKDGRYTDDLWGKHAEEVEGRIPEGYTVYGEIVGWASSGKMIQKDYDYGITRGESELWVYRITHTDAEGVIKELSWNTIELFCSEFEFKSVPVIWSGLLGNAKDVFPDVAVDDNWKDNFLHKLKETYLDKPCAFCTTSVVGEGIVVKINSKEAKPALKFKSPMFNINEGKLRDEEYEDMEDLN